MSDTIIKFREWPTPLIEKVFLDGVVQRGAGITEINLTKGTITRGYRGEPIGAHQVKTDQGYVFDNDEEDFVLETVSGTIIIEWKDIARARAWLAQHDQ